MNPGTHAYVRGWTHIEGMRQLIRAMIGPRITDRILSINMLGTMVISGIAVLSRLLDESYLVDVALIYAMISFLAVMMLAEVYIPAARRKGEKPGGKRHG